MRMEAAPWRGGGQRRWIHGATGGQPEGLLRRRGERWRRYGASGGRGSTRTEVSLWVGWLGTEEQIAGLERAEAQNIRRPTRASTPASRRTNKCRFIGVLAGCPCLATENSNSHLMTSRQAIDFIVLKAQVFSLRNQKIKHMLQVYVWKHPNGEYESLAFLLLSGIAPKLQPSSPNSNKKACLCFKYSFRKHPTQLNQEKIWFKPS